MKKDHLDKKAVGQGGGMRRLLPICALILSGIGGAAAREDADGFLLQGELGEARLKMEKWIETQQIISKERKEWRQGKEILSGRLDLVKREITALQDKIRDVEVGIEEANKKRRELDAEQDQYKAAGARLAEAVTAMEGEVRGLSRMLPEPMRERLQPLYQRIPEDPSRTRVSAAERFQNVLGILNEINKANHEITVSYEVRNLADGKPAEVRVLYLGLAQAYYVSARGEAGVGRPGPEGWIWEAGQVASAPILRVLEILQGKHSAAFVPLPAKIQ
jgi:hypothetical protein